MGSERRPYQCKYWNLRPVVMPECSLIATRNSHATHNKSVGRIPEHRQSRVSHQSHEMSSERRSKKLQILELTSCSHVGLFVDSRPKFTCQTQEISGSHTSRPDKQDSCFRAIKSGNAKKNACVEEALTIYLDGNNP